MKGDETKKRAEYFLAEGSKVHIGLTSGRFYNGKIVKIENDLLIINDDKLGELPIWFSQIKEDGIEPFKEAGA